MFALTANKVHLRLSARELLTSGSQNIYICQFTFSSDWDGIDRLAVFQAGREERSVILNEDNECQIPHEVLASPGKELFVGVYGTRDGEVVMPTILASLGEIHKGTNSAESAKDPTPGVYEQILDIAREAKKTADSVREDADEGKFQGPAGAGFPPGGLAGQVLTKNSDEDYDATWKHQTGGGGTGTGGADGFSPTVSVTQIDGGNRVTITDQNGPKNFDVMDGANGITPNIGDNGNWFIGETDTGIPSSGDDGEDGTRLYYYAESDEPFSTAKMFIIYSTNPVRPTDFVFNAGGYFGKIVEASGVANYYNVRVNPLFRVAGADGQDGLPGADGADGITPHIGGNGNWWIGTTDTGKPSRGEDGATGSPGAAGSDGQDGQPGADGEDGITPHIGENGNWFIGETDTGEPSRGEAGVYYGAGEPPANALVQIIPDGESTGETVPGYDTPQIDDTQPLPTKPYSGAKTQELFDELSDDISGKLFKLVNKNFSENGESFYKRLSAFKSIELSGFNTSRPHSIVYFTRNNSTEKFRIIITEYDGEKWIRSYDQTVFNLVENTDGDTTVELVGGYGDGWVQDITKNVRLVIDLSKFDPETIYRDGMSGASFVNGRYILQDSCFLENNQTFPVRYSLDNDTVRLFAKYNNTLDICFELKKKGGNNLFDFYRFYKILNYAKCTISTNLSSGPYLDSYSDWHAPFRVRAVNNIDGDNPNSHYLTGGNHEHTNTGSGGAPTARTTDIKFFADNFLVSTGTTQKDGFANKIKICWTNYVQGYNTAKSDGSGREILKELHSLEFDGFEFQSNVRLIPLENIVMESWYGFQCLFGTAYNGTLRYLGGANRSEIDITNNVYTSSGKGGYGIIATKGSDVMEMIVDKSVDLGDFSMYDATEYEGMWTSSATPKAYCNFFYNKEIAAGAMFSAKTVYKFYSK